MNIDLAAALKQLKKQRDFLRWMGRRYLELNAEQAEAFNTGARIIDEFRIQLREGEYDLEAEPATAAGELETPAEKELFTEELADIRIQLAGGDLRLEQAEFARQLQAELVRPRRFIHLEEN